MKTFDSQNSDSRLFYHIGLTEAPGAAYALLPGDPGRVPQIAARLDGAEFLASNREYTTYAGTLSGANVLVTSTGIGGASAAIAVEELYRAGVRTFIRIGTCGGMQTDVIGGDLVIATAAARMEGTSREYTPPGYPAAADFEVISALANSAEQAGAARHIGVVQSKDSFYGQHEPERMPVARALEANWDACIKAGCIASEMECAAVFSAAGVLRARSGAVLSVVWNQERAAKGLSNPQNFDVSAAVSVAVDALKLLIARDRA
ncbi:MAG: uridine phosphorylase [Clostridiales bacterium]|nr:uridine phosphorylase [Clostridiales bacterium]